MIERDVTDRFGEDKRERERERERGRERRERENG